jgi:LysR family glycine cleavage system transcriptional activator
MVKIPSIATLRALEAAARLESYSGAAREMNLTHGAVSHRLRALESSLGAVLFERHGNAMRPTAEARRLAGKVRQAFDVLEPAFEQCGNLGRSGGSLDRVIVSVVPALATFFLADRLASFESQNPDCRVDLQPNPETISLGKGAPGLAIRYGAGPWAGTTGIALPEHDLIAVASPDYLKSLSCGTPVEKDKRALFKKATLLRHRWMSWRPWLKHNGLEMPDFDDGPLFEESTLLLRAAVRDGGVALSVRPYVIDQIKDGHLVELPFLPLRDPNRFHLLWPAEQKPHCADKLSLWLAEALEGANPALSRAHNRTGDAGEWVRER